MPIYLYISIHQSEGLFTLIHKAINGNCLFILTYLSINQKVLYIETNLSVKRPFIDRQIIQSEGHFTELWDWNYEPPKVSPCV